MHYTHILIVFVGGGLGSVSRYFLGKIVVSTLPVGTFTANVLASLIFGFFIGIITQSAVNHSYLKLFILTGFCGGLSTFSSFNAEIFEMFKNNNIITGLIYIMASLLACMLSFGCAIWVSKFVN